MPSKNFVYKILGTNFFLIIIFFSILLYAIFEKNDKDRIAIMVAFGVMLAHSVLFLIGWLIVRYSGCKINKDGPHYIKIISIIIALCILYFIILIVIIITGSIEKGNVRLGMVVGGSVALGYFIGFGILMVYMIDIFGPNNIK